MQKQMYIDVDGYIMLTKSNFFSHTDCDFMELRKAFTS